MFISFHAGLLYAAGCTLRTATARPVCISSVQCGGNLAQVRVYTGMARQRRDLSMTAMKISPIPSQRRECQINGVIFTKVVFLLVMALLSSRPLSLSTHAALSVFIVACHFTGRSEKQIVADNTRGLILFCSSFRSGMTINCNGIPENMMALNLFGYQQIRFGNQILSCIISMMNTFPFYPFSHMYPLAMSMKDIPFSW